MAHKEQYKESYRKPGLKLKAACLPTLPSATGFVVQSAYILHAGRADVDGEVLEFQDVRIYLKEAGC